MRIPQSYVQRCKVVAHCFQALFIFIAGCITISVFTKGTTGGPSKFFFALCFLSAPALIYLVMTPMWSRAARFANAYAFVALDALYTILWFAAFISVAVWNSDGIRNGAKAKNVSSGNCSTFEPGSKSMCELSKAAVDFGIVIFIFFLLTAVISAYYAMKFRKDGIMPYEGKAVDAHHLTGDNAQKDNAWSTEIEQEGHESDDEDRHTEHGGNQQEDEYALLHSTETDEGRHPGRPLSWGDDRFGREQEPVPPYVNYEHDDVSALSPGGYEEYRRDAGAAPYQDAHHPGAGGQGYSFSGGDR